MNQSRNLRLKVSPALARLIREGSREERMAVARGQGEFQGPERVTSLLFLIHGKDRECRMLALKSLRRIDAGLLLPLVSACDASPRILDLIAKVRIEDSQVMGALLDNDALAVETLLHIARTAPEAILSLLVDRPARLDADAGVVAAILGNPHASEGMKRLLKDLNSADGDAGDSSDASHCDAHDLSADMEPGETAEAPSDENLSKYQMSLELQVAEKIKLALTGDKEWRSIFLKDANKLVCGAVMKNPRITDGEVLGVAKNKSSSEELIRLITLNNDWIKNYEIKKALVVHNRTPLPKALRYMNILSEKDLKNLAKSREVSSVIVNNARRMLMAKEKKK